MTRSKLSNNQGMTRKHWGTLSVIAGLFVLLALGGSYLAQNNRSKTIVLANAENKIAQEISSNYEVLDIRFDPVAIERNKVSIKVRNLTDQSQVAAVYIQTHSRKAGWGSTFFSDVAPQQEKWCNFFFKIQEDVVDETRIRLRFYNPPLPSHDSIQWDDYFLERKFYGSELERRKPDSTLSLPATPELTAAITSRFQEFQDLLQQEKYADAWNTLTLPCQQTDFHALYSVFEKNLNKSKKKSKQIQSLKPKEVVKKGSLYILHATLDSANWKISFASDEGQWKIDAIEGYVELSKRDRFLAKFQHRKARHFDIYYKKKSTAEHDIDKIADERDSGYEEICKFLGIESDIRITLAFYEDMETKRNETGHQGAGMARGTNIVEVYNKKMQLDPFHETTHVLTNDIGNPPAIFNEGFATYMSERLGSPPLKNLSGGDSSLYERVRELKSKGDWIPLEELVTYTDIGPGWSRPPVAYPEAGAFVKFLIDTYGKEKFFEVYKNFTNSEIKSILKQNEEKLKKIYGFSLADLEEQWIKAFTTG